MKHNFVYLFAITIVLLIAGCKKEEPEEIPPAPPESYFKFEGQTYELKNARVLVRNIGGAYYLYDLQLYSGFTVAISDSNLVTLQGTGDAVTFLDLYGTTPKLETESYTILETQVSPGHFTGGNILIDYNMQTNSGHVASIKGGSLSISDYGNYYIVSFYLTDQLWRVVEGTVKAEITHINLN